jgi:phosphinothricin acetyltransferase
MREQDWPAVKRIYEEGIATGHSTFQAAAPETWEQFQAGKVAGCSLVATDADGACVGWVVLSPTSARPVYAGVTELSVYIAQAARGRGVGTALLKAAIAASEDKGIWTLCSGTFPENVASVRLQLAHGFRIVGTRERIGLMGHGPLAGCWRDLLLLERRSGRVGG